MTEPVFRTALEQLVDAIDGWEIEPATGDPLAIAMDHARKLLKTAEKDERLSSGKLVSERLDELFAEVEQRDLEPTEVILGRIAAILKGSPALPAPGFQTGPQEYIPHA